MIHRTIGPTCLFRYAQALRREERASATVEKYLRDAADFAAWLGPRPLSRDAAAGWKAHLLSRGLAPATVNAKLSALNGLLRSLGREDCRARFLKLQRRAFRDEARDLSRGEYARLLRAAQSSGRTRLALLLEAICSTGIRVSETRHFTVEAARRGRADVSLKGKIRSGEIFLARDGTNLSRCQIWREMKSLCQAAGVAPSKVFPHNLRHLFAAAFYQATRDIVKLADILGHSSINTTRIYLLSTGTEHVRQLERLRLVT